MASVAERKFIHKNAVNSDDNIQQFTVECYERARERALGSVSAVNRKVLCVCVYVRAPLGR